MREGYDENPINPLPLVVWLLAAPIVAFELAFGLGQSGIIGGAQAAGWRLDALQNLAFSPGQFRQMVALNTYPPEHLMRLLTYPFVQGSVTEAIFVIVFLLALGKFVGEVFAPWALAAVFFGSAVIAALVYAALPFTQFALAGGYPADYGLIGAFTWLLWTRLGQANANRMRAFSLIGFLMGIQLVFALLFGARPDWIADVAGFAAGFMLSFVLAPGGWSATLARLRRR